MGGHDQPDEFRRVLTNDRIGVIEQRSAATEDAEAAVIAGMAPEGEKVPIDALSLPRNEKILMGTYYGSARPWIDLPRLVDLYMAKRLRVDELVTRTYSLDEINVAYEALGNGDVARSVIIFD